MRPEHATLLDVLIDAFEKNEMLDGMHWRTLPLPDEAAAVSKLAELAEEARRWKGEPTRDDDQGVRRVISWPGLELRRVGRGIMVRVRAPRFSSWWDERDVWAGDPMGPIFEWIDEESGPE
jgi:hypothetical protein